MGRTLSGLAAPGSVSDVATKHHMILFPEISRCTSCNRTFKMLASDVLRYERVQKWALREGPTYRQSRATFILLKEIH
jgi:hypothetical protein